MIHDDYERAELLRLQAVCDQDLVEKWQPPSHDAITLRQAAIGLRRDQVRRRLGLEVGTPAGWGLEWYSEIVPCRCCKTGQPDPFCGWCGGAGSTLAARLRRVL